MRANSHSENQSNKITRCFLYRVWRRVDKNKTRTLKMSYLLTGVSTTITRSAATLLTMPSSCSWVRAWALASGFWVYVRRRGPWQWRLTTEMEIFIRLNEEVVTRHEYNRLWRVLFYIIGNTSKLHNTHTVIDVIVLVKVKYLILKSKWLSMKFFGDMHIHTLALFDLSTIRTVFIA